MEPLQIVPATPPVEATLRILLNSVPYLIGCAVVRQPAGADAVAAEVGRNPWLFDRRLTTLELPDDTLPANRAVALDWPVPYQAEWVGVPPRLLISRLVFADRTVGVLLGTLVTREALSAQTREAMDLSCELIASAMAMYSAASLAAPPLPQPTLQFDAPAPAETVPQATAQAMAPSRPDTAASAPLLPPALDVPALQHPAVTAPAPSVAPAPSSAPLLGSSPSSPPAPALSAETIGHIERIASQISSAVSGATDARAIGRILRDAMNEVSEASAFAVALFHAARPEVAYRYKVVGVDAASSELGKQPVDDSPSCFAVRNAERWHAFDRAVSVAGERRRVGVLQVPLYEGHAAIGVVTLQTFREGGFAQGELALIGAIVNATAPGFAEARAGGRFQPSASPASAASPAPAAQSPDVQAPPRPETTDEILADVLVRCAELGTPTSFIVGLDPQAGLLRGDRVSASVEAGGIDRLIGISNAQFSISIDDRYNAIARACREARIVSVPTVHELVQPAHDWNLATLVERLAGGARSTVAPIIVNGDVVGALVAGPRAEELAPAELEQLRSLVESAGHRLAAAWRAASLGGNAAVDVTADALQAARSEHVA